MADNATPTYAAVLLMNAAGGTWGQPPRRPAPPGAAGGSEEPLDLLEGFQEIVFTVPYPH